MEQKITRKINLDENDGLSAFLGMHSQQNHNVYQVFFEFIKKTKPKRVLEIGTALGGFTDFLMWISKEINHDMYILSYDVHEHSWYKDLITKGIDIRIQNVFNENYTEVNTDVVDFINGDGTTLVLCDGGYKIGEFNLLSNFLKKGDFIMAHDYAEDRETFDTNIKGKIWNWFEISYSDIQDACLRNNLENFDKEIFESVVWTCREKKY